MNFRLWIAILLVFGASSARAQPADPVLRIEAGAHVARSADAAMDAAERILVTASDDKTARIWSLPDLRPLGVLRPPIGSGNEGMVYAVAVSPDGRFAALGGWTRAGANDVLIFDLATRQVVRRLGDLPNVINALAFSADGARLAAGLGGANGIRLWRVADGAPLGQDLDYADQVKGLSFAPDGRLAATSNDGAVRLYDPTGRRISRKATTAGRRPFRIRFNPDGTLLAISFDDVTALEVRDGSNLVPRTVPDVVGLIGSGLNTVAWSADGRTLYAGGSPVERSLRPVYAWGNQGSGQRRMVEPGFGDRISTVLSTRDGGFILTSLAADIAVVGREGRRVAERRQGSGNLDTMVGDLTSPSRRFWLGQDGQTVQWAFFDAPGRWLRFDATRLDFSAGQPPQSGLTDWSIEAPGLRVTDWEGRPDPKLNGRPLRLSPLEWARGVAVTPGRVLVGGSWFLRLFGPDAAMLWQRPVPGAAFRVNQSADGRLAVAALADGTIRWYRLSDGQELLALFVTPDATRWVAWTPSGYFAASPGGEDLIGWHVNRASNQAADFFSGGRFRDRFYRPDVVQRALETLDENEALRVANSSRRAPSRPVAPIVQELPPVVAILTPREGTVLIGPEVTIDYSLRSPSGRPVRTLRATIDGRPAEAARGLDLSRLRPDPGRPAGETRGRVTLPIPPGQTVIIGLLAESGGRTGEPALLRISGMPVPAATVGPMAPRLNAVVVGVSAYPNPAHRLNYAAKDARDLAAALEAQRGRGLYREVNLRLLADADATRGNILRELEWLRRNTTSNDVAVVFLAGHGLPDEGRTFFLPVDGDPESLFATAVAQTDLQGILSRVPGRVVAFVDICHAGGAVIAQNTRSLERPDMTAFIEQLREPGSGLIVFAAATSRQPAVEIAELRNGAFTSALLQGIGGAADLNRDGAVRTDELNVYIADRVRDLTRGRQSPVMQRPGDVPDFPIVAVRR